MKKILLGVFMMSMLMFLTVSNADAYYPWDEPVLDLKVKSMNIFQKFRDNTVFIDSCDAVKKVCLHYNKIPYVPITAKIYEIMDDGNLRFIEQLESETGKNGYTALVIFPNHLYDAKHQYQIEVTGFHESKTETKVTSFWLYEKHY